MTRVRRLGVQAIICAVLSPLSLVAVGAGLQSGATDQAAPTAIEQALIDYVCGAARVGGPGSDTYQACLDAGLLSLRADFGRDLSKLSTAERRALDSVCTEIRTTGGREAYVECINAQLASLRNRRNRNAPVSPAPLTRPPSQPPAPAPVSQAVTAVPVGRSFAMWFGAVAAVLLAVAGGVTLARKSRRAPRTCRTCGADVREGGDLCQNCRHEAAAALRRASAERAEQQRAGAHAKQEDQRRQVEREEEQRRERARLEEEDRQRREEQTRRDEESARVRIAEARQQVQAHDAPGAFDPYDVLGIPRNASREDIETAYQHARAKYDVEQVLGLGSEMEEHYKAKTRAIDRAHAMLTG